MGGPPPGLDGKVRKAIMSLAVPMAFAEITSMVLMVGVVALMGHMGDDALYVRALYLPMMPLFAGVYLAFEISNQVAAAMSRGAGRPQDVLPVALSFIRVWAVIGVVIFVAFLFAAPLFADVFDVPVALRGEFISFLRWMTVAELTHVGVLLWASSLRGYGKAGSGALVTISSRVVQFGGVALLGLGFGLGPNTVPVSIAAGSVVGCLLGIVMMRKAGLWIPGGKGSWRRPEAGANLKMIGIPVAMTQVLMFGCYFGLLAVLGGFGPIVVSAFSSATSIQFLILMPGVLLGSATAIVLNMQRGAGVTDGLRKVLRVGIELTVIAYLVIAVAVWAGNHLLGDIMSSSAAISSETAVYLGIVAFTFVIQGPVLTSLMVMEQTGAGPLAALLNFIYYAAVVLTSALVAGSVHNAEGVYKTIAYCNLAGISVVIVAVLVVRKIASKPAAQLGQMGLPAGP
ncbi:MATE family efflux transporter [Amycolatopsis sp. H20-H5]|uniref:MATE family efflux transporter n=1 Tax=Amycolatopsis sp. H20-H5 TaxID=3046309 RepID=UPI002DB8FDEA|nr:MATE family efflux transporter [Amycolatopsis sp. H20-H5]MEC3976897.1 MATE family efflux transporter [Amycolatopsis sp. H20-H5]